jgi:hypothetical protein
MKTVFIAVVVLLSMCSISFATLTQVNLISQSHEVKGYVDNTPDTPATYDITDSVPISGDASTPYGIVHSQTYDLKVSGYTSGGSSSYWAEAYETYVFKPYGTLLDFSFSQSCDWTGAPWGSWFSYSLKDLDTDTVLTSFTGDDDFIWANRVDDQNYELYEGHSQFTVFTDHRYELYLAIHADAMDGTGVDLSADIVPEPATVLMLVLGSALMRTRKLSAAN